jgi:hypothetical protein
VTTVKNDQDLTERDKAMITMSINQVAEDFAEIWNIKLGDDMNPWEKLQAMKSIAAAYERTFEDRDATPSKVPQ